MFGGSVAAQVGVPHAAVALSGSITTVHRRPGWCTRICWLRLGNNDRSPSSSSHSVRSQDE